MVIFSIFRRSKGRNLYQYFFGSKEKDLACFSGFWSVSLLRWLCVPRFYGYHQSTIIWEGKGGKSSQKKYPGLPEYIYLILVKRCHGNKAQVFLALQIGSLSCLAFSFVKSGIFLPSLERWKRKRAEESHFGTNISYSRRRNFAHSRQMWQRQHKIA